MDLDLKSLFCLYFFLLNAFPPDSFDVVNLVLDAANIKKEAGPISMSFTIPMFNASRLAVCAKMSLVDTFLC